MRAWRDDPVIARAAPFLLFVAFIILSSALPAAFTLYGVDLRSSWLVMVRGAVIGLLLLWFWRGYTELHRPAAARAADWVLGVALGIAVFFAWISIDQDWAVLSRSAGYMPLHPDGSVNRVQAFVRLAGFSLAVPVMEELFWRSLVLRWIERHEFQSVVPRDVGWRAFAITTVLFALEHDRWLSGAIAGAAYNWLYMRSGNLWVPILAHVVTNAALGVWILQTHNWQFW